MKWKEKCECCKKQVWFMNMQIGKIRICNDCTFDLQKADVFPTHILKRVLEERNEAQQ